ncbi:MAG TPA: hypothetical protein PKK91_05290, partial [bacterium]|nr:hypothetical protein [bacterium]
MAKEPLGEVDSSEAIVIILRKIVVVKQVGFIAGEQALNGGMDPSLNGATIGPGRPQLAGPPHC